MSQLIDLDDPRQKSLLVAVLFRGVKMAISRDRLLELLQREEELLSLLAGSPLSFGVGGLDAPPRSASGPRRADAVTHASLSSRIKKIHNYSLATRRLRPAHIGLLQDLVENFDWAIPEHANTKLEQHLAEMLEWDFLPDDFRDKTLKFLKRYLKARGLPGPLPGARKKE